MSDSAKLLNRAFAELLDKKSFAPAEQVAPPDPAAAGAAPPGAMPPGAMPPGAMPPGGDPAAAGAMPPGAMPPGAMPPGMDPAAMGMAPPGEDPILQMIEKTNKAAEQTLKIVAAIADQLEIKIPLNDVLDVGEDPLANAPTPKTAAEEPLAEPEEVTGDGFASELPTGGITYEYQTPAHKLSSAVRVANRMFRK